MKSTRLGSALQSLTGLEVDGISLSKLVTKARDTGLQLIRPNPDIYLTTPQLIEKHGYPVETHKVTTEDGYILTMHRIPSGRNSPKAAPPGGKPVVLLQSGTFCASSVFVLSKPEKALAFRLADQNYDVWMANSRGTTYSKEHVSLSVKSKEFWNFSYEEMGQYDVPANIDYILNHTGQTDLHYIGHSLGSTIFFVAMALRPEYNSKIRLMSALAPVAYLGNCATPLAKLHPIRDQIYRMCQFFGVHEMLPHSPLMQFLAATVTHHLSPFQALLPNALFLLCGYDYEQIDKNLMSSFLGHMPAGISTKSLVQFGQGVSSGEFRHYCYGRQGNQAIYGQVVPPNYDLSKVTAPVALYYASNDWLCAQKDVDRLADTLPNLAGKYLVPFEKFNHMDFLFAISAPSLLYEKLEKDMKELAVNIPN